MWNNRLARWEYIRRKQMGYLLHTILILSMAFFAYLISFLSKDEEVVQDPSFIKAIIFISVITIILNLLSSLIRLIDFRKTADKIRKGKKDSEYSITILGKCTWGLLFAQLISFVATIILFLIYVLNFL